MKKPFELHYGNSPHRPDLHGILLSGQRGKLLATLYTAAGAGQHPTVLLFHGIPGCEQNLDLAQTLRRAGFHVLTFHYSGCWGSDGNYALAHNLEDANTALDFILKDRIYDFDKNRIYGVGHSLGGFVCGQLAAHRPEIRGAVLLAPCDVGRLPQLAGEDTGGYQTLLEILNAAAPWLTGVTGESLRQEAVIHSETFRLECVADQLAKKPLLCIGGTLDIHTPPAYHCEPVEQAIRTADGSLLRSVRYPTDHFFADYRLTMAETVTDYLTELAREPSLQEGKESLRK
ncbi:MAG: alpha/beta fold hydrolase [Bacillota bacterium]|nr:alpha/beta fold hydrolase [Bacillota bacterium]